MSSRQTSELLATGKVPGSAGHADPCPRRLARAGPGTTERCDEARAVAAGRGHRQHSGPGARDPHREIRRQHPVDRGRGDRQPEPARHLGDALPQPRLRQPQRQPGQPLAERPDVPWLPGLTAGRQPDRPVDVSGRHALQRRLRRDHQLGSHSPVDRDMRLWLQAHRREAGAGCGNIVVPRPGDRHWRARTCSRVRSDSEVDMAQVVP